MKRIVMLFILALAVTDLPAQSIAGRWCTPITGGSVCLGFSVTGVPNPTTRQLFFRRGGERTFQSLELRLEAGEWRADIPPAFVTIRGIEYFVRFANATVALTYPAQNPESNPAIARVDMVQSPIPVPFQRLRYRMFSVPAHLADSTLQGVLTDDYGTYDPARWRVFRLINNAYEEFPAIGTRVVPGKAFWLITENGAGFDVDDARSVRSDQPYGVVVPAGQWEQIAVPFAFPVSWDSVAGSRSVSRPLFFTGEEFVPAGGALQPWEGYFVRNSSAAPVQLVFPPREAPPVAALPKEPATGDEYRLLISASMPSAGLVDSFNEIGFSATGDDGDDQQDIHEPPALHQGLRVLLRRGTTPMMADIRAIPEQGAAWGLEISSPRAGGEVVLSLRESGVLPRGFGRVIVDTDNGRELEWNDLAIQVPQGRARTLRILVGTPEFLARSGQEATLPGTVRLDQNFPNPFNPSTTIRFGMPTAGTVRLEVFNLVGHRIRSLVQGERGAGMHEVVWDGRDDAGKQVSSGLFFSRLEAGGTTLVRRMLLVR